MPVGRYSVEFSAEGGYASGGDYYSLTSGIYISIKSRKLCTDKKDGINKMRIQKAST